MAESIQINDGLLNGGRRPLYLVVDASGNVHRLEFKTLPGIAAVIPGIYEKNGKWSNTTYQVVLAAGCRLVDATAPLHGSICRNAATWAEAAAFVGVSVEALKRIFDPAKPNAQRWDAVDAALASVK